MKTIGKISGGLGLLVLLSSPFTLVLTSETWWPAAIKAGAGLAMIALWAFTRPPRTAAPTSIARVSFFYSSSVMMSVVVIGALVAINFIAARRAKTWDLTTNKIHSLAPQTTQTLKGLKEPVQAIGFLPTTHGARDQLEHLFKAYAAQSDSFTYDFKDPFKAPDLAQRYQLKEGQVTVVLTRGVGEAQTHTSLSAVSEEALTKALIKLNTVGIQKVYFVVGHGEWTLSATQPMGPEDPANLTTASEFKTNLSQEGYAPEELNLAESRDIPHDASLLLIAGARVKLGESEVALLEKYLEQGGRMIYFAEQGREPGLDLLLARYGVQVDNGLLVDDKVNPKNPYVIVTGSYGEHEITRILKSQKMNVQLPTARGLSLIKEGTAQGVMATPVVTTSPFAWEESAPTERPSLDSGEKTGAIPMVIAVTRDTKGAADKRFDEGRLVVFGDAELLVDALYGHEPNRNLVMNAVGWASNQIQNITIRPPDRDISTLDVDEVMLARIRFLSMDLLPILLVGVGLSIWVTRRNK